MSDRSEGAGESTLLGRLRDRAQRDDLAGVRVTFRLSGGAPGNRRIVEEVLLSGDRPGIAQRTGLGRDTYSVNVEPAKTRELLRDLGLAAQEFIPRREAQFLPDSLVGAVVVEVDGQSETMFYNADPQPDERSHRSDRLNGVIHHLERLLWDTERSAG